MRVMLDYKLIERTANRILYLFIPTGNKRPGKVAFYPDGRKEVIEDSPDDVKRYYATHALNDINVEKDEGYLIWC